MYEIPAIANYGWQCPGCHRVYSPTTPMCYCCGGDTVVTNTTEEKKDDGIIRKIMVGYTPETMKTMTTGGEVK